MQGCSAARTAAEAGGSLACQHLPDILLRSWEPALSVGARCQASAFSHQLRGGGGGEEEKFNQRSCEARPTRCRVEMAKVSSPQVDLNPLWPGQYPYSLSTAVQDCSPPPARERNPL